LKWFDQPSTGKPERGSTGNSWDDDDDDYWETEQQPRRSKERKDPPKTWTGSVGLAFVLTACFFIILALTGSLGSFFSPVWTFKRCPTVPAVYRNIKQDALPLNLSFGGIRR
jgi:hypothetical protein